MKFIKSPTFWTVMFVVITGLATLFIYALAFKGHPFSTNNQDWAHFAAYFSGIMMPLAGTFVFWQLIINKKAELNKIDQDELIDLYQSRNAYIQGLISRFDPFLKDEYGFSIDDIIYSVADADAVLKAFPENPETEIKYTDPKELLFTSLLVENIKEMAMLTQEIKNKHYANQLCLNYGNLIMVLGKEKKWFGDKLVVYGKGYDD